MKNIIAFILSFVMLISVCGFEAFASQIDIISGSVVDEPTQSVKTIVFDKQFLLTDNLNWDSAFIYAWDNDGNEILGAWPGSPITEKISKQYSSYESEEYFVCNIPSVAAGVIISNGEGERTEEITNFTSFNLYWFDGRKNEFGQYLLNGEITDILPENKPIPENSIMLVNSFGWENAYVYAINEYGNSLCGEYPGSPVTMKTVNGYGEEMFVCEIPENSVSVIISDGLNQQTEEITDFKTYDYYVMYGSKNQLGQYIVSGIAPVIDSDLKIGDVNGDNVIDILDAIQIQKYTVEKLVLNNKQINAGDVNNDGRTDVLDAIEIQKFATEKISEF